MESVQIDSGAFVAPTTSPTDQQLLDQITSHSSVLATPARPTYTPLDSQTSAWLDTPANAHVTNHFEASNVRGSADQDLEAPPFAGTGYDDAQTDATRESARIHREGKDTLPATPFQSTSGGLPSEPKTPSNAASFGMEKSGTVEAAEAEQLTRAYAMVKFRDSHCYITTPNLVIVRDVHFLQDWQAQEKERKRRAKAHEALQQYALEPSQPSQPGDDDRHDPSSRSGDSLVGRPERGLLSHYSEQGGPVAYALSDEEEEMRSTQRKRRLLRSMQNSSSTNSIAPQNLHPNAGSEFLQTGTHFDSDGHPSDPLEWAQLPVHPPRPEDIKKISREHLIFSYNSDSERWELKVIGNRAFVNGTLYDKHDVIPLSHNDEIIIASLTMNFMLPDDLIREAESEAPGDDIIESVEAGSCASLTPDRQLSNAVDDSDDEGHAAHGVGKKRSGITIKLNLRKGHGKEGAKDGGKAKGKGKSKGDEKPSTTSASPEATKKHPKARKPSATAESVKEEPTAASPPTLPLNLDPNSTLAGLAPEELPEKRKGPGRPPKNGLVSKRDEAIIRKKIKVFEKNGLVVPDYRLLLIETRAENKKRDLANKAQARGEPIPDVPVPSIESARLSDPNQLTARPTPDGNVQGTDSPAVPERKPSPKPRRAMRSPSPMKPITDFTEEELKKPSMTYIYIIDEILQNVEGGQADLQTIYDKIQKRWPYYYYKVTSSGWQSSVRHNLLSCPRFQDAGKSGKGKFWTINYDHQLDKQKRKPSPPPTRPPPQSIPNGQFVPNGQGAPQPWYGSPAYNGPYGAQNSHGQAPPNPASQPGNGTYYSPYAPSQSLPSGNHLPPGPGHAAPMAPMGQPTHGPYPPNGSHAPHPPHPNGAHQQPPTPQPPPQAQSQAAPFQPVVDAIMDYRTEYLGRCVPDSDEFRRCEHRFKAGTQYFSNLFHHQANAEISGEDLSKEPFSRIEQIFERFKHLFSTPQQNGTNSPVRNANNPSQAGGQTNGGTYRSMPAPVPHATTASSVGMQQAHSGASQAHSAASSSSMYTGGAATAAVAPTDSMPVPVSAAPASTATTSNHFPAADMAPSTNMRQSAVSMPPQAATPSHDAPSIPVPALQTTVSPAPANQPLTVAHNQSAITNVNDHAPQVSADTESITGNSKITDTASRPESPTKGIKRMPDGFAENDDTKRIKTE